MKCKIGDIVNIHAFGDALGIVLSIRKKRDIGPFELKYDILFFYDLKRNKVFNFRGMIMEKEIVRIINK